MFINKELFILRKEEKDKFILYAPLSNCLMEVNSGVISILKKVQKGQTAFNKNQLETIQFLKNNNILLDEDSDSVYFKFNELNKNIPQLTTSACLMPTNDCNLECIYCYASAGAHKKSIMDFSIARKTVDFIVHNAINGNNEIKLQFHGGGEPFHNFPLLKKTVEYLKKLCSKHTIRYKIFITTNGILNIYQLKWIHDNNIIINLSCDGPEDIQNYQRPLKGGECSYPHLIRTLKYFNENKIQYSIRSTITFYSINRMEDMLDFFIKNTNIKEFHFEPVFECGRCYINKIKKIDPNLFLNNFLKTKEKAKINNITLFCAASKIDMIVNNFCGANGRNLVVTPEGNITSCFERTDPSESRANLFFYGKVDGSKIIFDENKIAKLQERVVQKMVGCENCFAKYSCAGYCMTNSLNNYDDLYIIPDQSRCIINKGIILYELNKILEEKNEREK